jgi:hypothetical protein
MAYVAKTVEGKSSKLDSDLLSRPLGFAKEKQRPKLKPIRAIEVKFRV